MLRQPQTSNSAGMSRCRKRLVLFILSLFEESVLFGLKESGRSYVFVMDSGIKQPLKKMLA